MYNGGAGSAAPTHSPAPVDAFDADEHDEFEWFRAGITLYGYHLYYKLVNVKDSLDCVKSKV